MNTMFYKAFFCATLGVSALECVQRGSEVHLYLLNDTEGAICIGKTRLHAFDEKQSQLCRNLHNHTLPVARTSDDVVIMRTVIIPERKFMKYPYKFK